MDPYICIYVGPGGLRARCVLACAMRSLAIVITIVQSFFCQTPVQVGVLTLLSLDNHNHNHNHTNIPYKVTLEVEIDIRGS